MNRAERPPALTVATGADTVLPGSSRVTARRGRRRSTAADAAIITAALGVLAEEGYSGFTVSAVVARAGVSTATLYRRWASKQELIVAALSSLDTGVPTIDTGTLGRDVEEFVDYLGMAMGNRRDDLPGVFSRDLRDDAELNRMVVSTFAAPRLEVLEQILERAVSRGELARMPSVDECWSLVAGPVAHFVTLRREAFTPAFARSTARFVAGGLRALAG